MSTKRERERVARDLEKVADYIEEHGWMQGSYHNEKGEVCVVGGINVVTCGSPTAGARIADGQWVNAPATARQQRVRLIRTLAGCIGLPLANPLTGWNDEQRRRKSDVLSTLRGCAENVRSGNAQIIEGT